MLQIFEDFKAKTSPCNYCQNMGREIVYPDCCYVCDDVNNYLKILGDKPNYDKDRNKNLSEVYPPKQTPGLKNIQYCAPEQYIELSEKLGKLRKKINSNKLSLMTGINAGTLSQLIRRVNKRIALKTYEKIMAAIAD